MQTRSDNLLAPVPRTRWPAVLAATLCGVAVAMNIGKVPIAMPQLRDEFGLSLVTAGWVSSTLNALAVTTAVLFGIVGDRVGAWRLCLTGLAISVFAGVAGTMSTNASVLLASRFVEGAGFVAVAVSAPALVSAASANAERRFALGIWSGYVPAGVGLAMLTAPLVSQLSGWQGLWVFTVLMLALAATAIYACRCDYHVSTPTVPDAGSFVTTLAALREPAAWILTLSFATYTIQYFALIIWLPTFLQEQLHYSAVTVSLLSFFMVIINVPGNLLGGMLVQRNVERGNLIALVSLLMGLAGFGIFSETLPHGVRYALCLAFSFVGGIIPAAVMSSSASLACTPRQVGTFQGLFMQGGNLGQFAGPPLVAALVAVSGNWRDTLFVTTTAASAGIGLGLIMRRYER